MSEHSEEEPEGPPSTEYLSEPSKLPIGPVLAVFAILLGIAALLSARGVQTKIRALEDRLGSLETQSESVRGGVEASSSGLENIEQRLVTLGGELGKLQNSEPSVPASVTRELRTLGAELKRLREDLAALSAVVSALEESGPSMPVDSLQVTEPTSTPRATALPPSNLPEVGEHLRAVPMTHKVVSGDTLSEIAQQYGVSLRALMDANPNVDPRRLQVGQVIQLPRP